MAGGTTATLPGSPLSSSASGSSLAAGAAGPQTSGTSGAPAQAGSATAGPGSATKRPAIAGPKTPVQIGTMVIDTGEALQLAGQGGNCNSDCLSSFQYSQSTMLNTVTAWANAHGGLAGRQIKLVTYTAKFADVIAQGQASVMEAACQYWTQDNHVSALMLENVVNDDLVNCAAQHQLPIINGDYSQYIPDKVELRGKGRYDYASANFNLDDAAKYYLHGLADQGFFKSGSKVGLIYKEGAIYQRAVNNTLLPELQRLGFSVDATAAWNDNDQGTQSMWTQYVVAFESKHVDRVLVFGGWDFGIVPFAKTADNQKYYPRYGVSSLVGPADFKVSGMPSDQERGLIGVGWWTFADVMYTGDASTFNSAAALCGKIIRAGGQPWNPYTYRNAMKFCDNVFLLKALADKAGTISQPAFYDAADHLGSSFTSPYMWKTTFRPGDHHGATLLRNLAYDQACDCIKYTSTTYLPHW